MSNHTLTQKAYQHIHDQLAGGLLKPGTRLSNRGVAKEVGVSFTPVREALSRLVSEGLLEYRQGLGVFVPMSSVQEIHESYELREILESEAAARVSENPPSGMLEEMRHTRQIMAGILEKISDPEEGVTIHDYALAWQEADSVFHMALLRATGNRRLLDTVKGLRTSLRAMMSTTLRGMAAEAEESSTIVGHRFATESHGHIKRTFDEHCRILEALEKGDATVAKAVMIEHIRSGMELALASHNRCHMGDTTIHLHGPHGL